MCDVISDAAAEEEEAIGWMFPSSGGFLLLGSSIADDVANDTKKGSIAKAQEGINSKGNVLDTIFIHAQNTTFTQVFLTRCLIKVTKVKQQTTSFFVDII